MALATLAQQEEISRVCLRHVKIPVREEGKYVDPQGDLHVQKPLI